MQPGDTITPAGQQPEPAAPTPANNPVVSPVPTPQPPAPEQPLPPTSESPQPATEQPPTFQNEPEAEPEQQPSIQPLSWTASEFIEHQKPHGWYVLLAGGSLLFSGILYLLVQDIITVVVVAVAALLFGIVGARKPRSMSYTIMQTGIQVGEKTFRFTEFKSFSVIEEGAIDSIQLAPLKRFMPPISLYFPPEQEEQIVDTLTAYLPHEDRAHDVIDRLMKRLHF